MKRILLGMLTLLCLLSACSDKSSIQEIEVHNIKTKNNTTKSIDSDEYVWLPEKGEKYHKINNCGKMNPKKATKVTKQEAINRGYEACKNCYE